MVERALSHVQPQLLETTLPVTINTSSRGVILNFLGERYERPWDDVLEFMREGKRA